MVGVDEMQVEAAVAVPVGDGRTVHDAVVGARVEE